MYTQELEGIALELMRADTEWFDPQFFEKCQAKFKKKVRYDFRLEDIENYAKDVSGKIVEFKVTTIDRLAYLETLAVRAMKVLTRLQENGELVQNADTWSLELKLKLPVGFPGMSKIIDLAISDANESKISPQDSIQNALDRISSNTKHVEITAEDNHRNLYSRLKTLLARDLTVCKIIASAGFNTQKNISKLINSIDLIKRPDGVDKIIYGGFGSLFVACAAIDKFWHPQISHPMMIIIGAVTCIPPIAFTAIKALRMRSSKKVVRKIAKNIKQRFPKAVAFSRDEILRKVDELDIARDVLLEMQKGRLPYRVE